MSSKGLNIVTYQSENQRLIAPGKKTAQPRNVLAEIGNINLNTDNNHTKDKPSNGVPFPKSNIPQLKGNPADKQGPVSYSKQQKPLTSVPQSKGNLAVKQGQVSYSKQQKPITSIPQSKGYPAAKQGLAPQSKHHVALTSTLGTKYTEKLFPAISHKFNEISKNKTVTVSRIKSPEKIKNVDENDQCDIFLLGRYVCDIHKYLLDIELKLPIEPEFLMGTSVTSSMRATLIDWLLDVQLHCHILLETLHLTVSIMDRFLQASGVIQKKHFQLVGITSMLLACKYEETHYPQISDLIYLTDNSYTNIQVLDLEKIILKKLDFRLGRPISLTFLRRYGKIVKADQFLYTTAKYFIELALLETYLASARPSQVAAAAIFIALCIKQNDVNNDLWTPTLQFYSSYSLHDFYDVIIKLATAILEAPNSKYKGIRSKYSKSEYLSVSVSEGLRSDSAVLRKLCKFKLC